jgi:hypothetical protein
MLDNVSQYIAESRTLLQDVIAPYRYADADLLSTLNMALQTSYRLRADLFLGSASSAIPSFVVNDTTAVPMDPMYRAPIVHFMVGHAQLRDEEDTQDSRAVALMNDFKGSLLSVAG